MTGPAQTVMVVDDDEDIRESLSLMLGQRGYRSSPPPTGRRRSPSCAAPPGSPA